MKTGITDQPNLHLEEDLLGLKTHSEALRRFIEQTDTPMTIGLQGEWGSGKTSLMNEIKGYFDIRNKNESAEAKVLQIWVNTWEKSLLKKPEDALIEILNYIISQLVIADSNVNKAGRNKKNLGFALSKSAKIAASFAGKTAERLADTLIPEFDSDISKVKDELERSVLELEERKTNPFCKILIYVDDLDRLEPKQAVAILELFKNLFSIKNCVFILAIDYQVIVKGLQQKFGEKQEDNEWEFRAFFDKIIQLPFKMPIHQYDIGTYVSSLLKKIGFINDNEKQFQSEEIKTIVRNSIGGNPRSIKRLVNSLSLIQIFTEIKNKNFKSNNDSSSLEKSLIFYLLCIQIAYPKIYAVLEYEPDFIESWDANKNSKDIELDEKQKRIHEEKAEDYKDTEFLDENWEQFLLKLCCVSPVTQHRFYEVRQLFDDMREKIESNNKSVGKIIRETLDKTSVTNTASSNNSSDEGEKEVRKEISIKEFCELKKIDEKISNFLEEFLNQFSQGAGLKVKATKSQISLKNIGEGKSVNVIYLSKRGKNFEIGFAGRNNIDENLKIFEEFRSRLQNIKLDAEVAFRKSHVLVKFDMDVMVFDDKKLKVLIEVVNDYRIKFL